ncbi:membrane protein [Bacteroidia bacterium]|nr:membrane protein [Bacteroidia bacterium]
MTFGICWFIVLMQFLWRYIDDMVGKGLSIPVLGEMFFYAALSLIPMALPLAILLSSLMTFGNLGERLELLAMKSAGISLIHIMRPLIILAFFVSIGSFYFQNVVVPVSQVKLWSLIYSMRIKSPELNIPERVFVNEIQGYNVYVREKDPKSGMLKDLMIYNYSAGFNNVSIIVADSGKMKASSDKLYLVLTLYNGEAFQNMEKKQPASAQVKEAVPYRRETFLEKELLIEFDANFSRVDETFFQNQYLGKSLNSLQVFVDSVSVRLDSIKDLNADAVYKSSYKRIFPNSIAINATEEASAVMNLDSVYQAQDPAHKSTLLSRVKSSLESVKSDYFFRGATLGNESLTVRRHLMEWHIKFSTAYACIMFFFIGAPLGAIIRKGGFGVPVVLSVLLYIFYYIINNICSKMARDAVWEVWQGMWLSSLILTALGVFLTYKAANDSALLNADTYINTLKSFIGKREMRKVELKEVIIFNPGYKNMILRLAALIEDTQQYLEQNKRWLNYLSYWKGGGIDTPAERIVNNLEEIVEELGNSDHILVLNKLMDYPVIGGHKQLAAYLDRRVSLAVGIFLPLGIPLFLLAVYQRKLLHQDLRTARKVSEELKDMIINLTDTGTL